MTKTNINDTHPVLSTRVPRKELRRFDAVAKRKGLRRSTLLRVLVRRVARHQ
jgi:antitoxin component of RelBE/YafQ-DinJ toxin-antitoxin module